MLKKLSNYKFLFLFTLATLFISIFFLTTFYWAISSVNIFQIILFGFFDIINWCNQNTGFATILLTSVTAFFLIKTSLDTNKEIKILTKTYELNNSSKIKISSKKEQQNSEELVLEVHNHGNYSAENVHVLIVDSFIKNNKKIFEKVDINTKNIPKILNHHSKFDLHIPALSIPTLEVMHNSYSSILSDNENDLKTIDTLKTKIERVNKLVLDSEDDVNPIDNFDEKFGEIIKKLNKRLDDLKGFPVKKHDIFLFLIFSDPIEPYGNILYYVYFSYDITKNSISNISLFKLNKKLVFDEFPQLGALYLEFTDKVCDQIN